MHNEILFKPNTLIKGSTAVSSNEYKIFNRILYKCQVTNNTQMIAELTLEELKELVKVKNDSTPKGLLDTLERLMQVIIRFEKEPNSNKFISTTLINKVEIDTDTRNFKCFIDKELYETLEKYRLGYAPIDLKEIKKLNGFYAQRIYELLRLWTGSTTTIEYKIDILKEILNLTESTAYDKYYNFKTRIIDKAVNEINCKLNMKIEYEEIKSTNRRKRGIGSLRFKVIDNEPRYYDFKKEKIIDTKYKDVEEKNEIDSIDYMNLIDCKINESVHSMFLNDFEDYKNYLNLVVTASSRTLDSVGGKTISKRNYKYFKVTLENLLT